jgi:tetratricopeptide (TPR) repeat protein
LRIYVLFGFAAISDDDSVLPVELTQRRILEALVYEGGVARSAEEIRRRAQLADANSVGQGLSRLRAAWSKILGPIAKEVFPEARASKGYRLQLARTAVDVWHLEDLQRTIRERIAAADPTENWDALAQTIREAEQVWTQAEKRHRDHPTALAEPASDLGKRVSQLGAVRLENRKRWAELSIRSGNRADLVLPILATWLNDEESPSRSDVALWRLWIEAKAITPGTTADDLDVVVENAKSAGLDVSVLEGVRRTAVTRLVSVSTVLEEAAADSRSSSAADHAGNDVADGSSTALLQPIAGLELTIRSAFVGRSRERTQLTQAGVQALRDHTGHLITITGEPGVGKSRLLAEVVSTITTSIERDSGTVSWFVGRCPAQGSGLRCWALGEIIKTIAGVRPHDAPEIAIAKLEEKLLSAHINPAEVPELVRHFSPLVGGSGGKSSSDTERFFAWARALDALRAVQPIALIFEDLHWADDMLLEFIDTLTEQGSPSGLLVVTTGRPEFLERFNGWGGGGRSATTLSLSRLTDQETGGLLTDFRTADDLPLSQEVQTAIIERSGGNPLFAEELARMVEHSGASATTGLPRMVELVVAARLDHLSEDAAHVAYAAATIGRVFWSGAIEVAAVLPPAALRNALAELVRLDLVQRSWSSSFTGQLEYTFWHSIVRDVAVARLPDEEIVGVRLRVANWLREAAGDRLNDVVEQLAGHYEVVLTHTTSDKLDSDSINHAIEAFRLAGRRAAIFDQQVATAHFKRALSITAKDHSLRASLLADYASCFEDRLSTDRGEQVCNEALSELEGNPDAFSRSRILATLGMTVSNKGDLHAALKLFHEALPGLQLGDVDEYMTIKSTSAFLYAAVGERDRALELIEDCWAWCKDAVGSGRSAHFLAASVYAWMVNPKAVVQWLDETLQDPNSRLHSSRLLPGNLAEIRSGLYGPRDALAILDIALERSTDRVGAVSVWIRGGQVDYLTLVGELSRAVEAAELALAEVRSIGTMLTMQFLGQKIFAQLLMGESINETELAELDELLLARPGTNEMILLGLRGSAVAHFVNGATELVMTALNLAVTIFETRIDRLSPLHSAIRLTMLRLAFGVGEVHLAQRIAATCDPLSPAQHAERVAIDGYMSAADGQFTVAAQQLGSAADLFETLNADLEATWIRLHQARFTSMAALAGSKGTASKGTASKGTAIEQLALNKLDVMGAFGVHSGVINELPGLHPLSVS